MLVVLMTVSSDYPNLSSSQFVRMGRNDNREFRSYHPNMARKRGSSITIGPNWHLAEWMSSKAMSQAELMRRTGWSKATTNDIYNGKTGYYRNILNEAAAALHLEPYELLMHPSEANHLRTLRKTALEIAAEEQAEWRIAPVDLRLRKNGD